MKPTKGLTIVIKLGTSSIVHEKTHEPRLSTLSVIVETAVRLRRDGHRVVLVSSGAIGVALQMMDMDRRPKHLPQVQALAALGQARLMSLWDRLFMHLKQPVAQILLTRNDIADRTQYLNAQNTMNELLNMGIIPIVNENDTISVAEIKFGDNDTLSAITAGMLSAEYLFLMTDVDCLYTTNPRIDPSAEPIPVVADISLLEADVSSAGSSLGTGGMGTKIVAAKLGTAAGVTTIITQASKPGNVGEIVDHLEALQAEGLAAASPDGVANESNRPPIPPAPLHTRFLPSLAPIRDRSFWLLHGLTPRGVVYIDEGAYRALRKGAGLLPVGVVGVEGNFSQHEAVRLVVVPRNWRSIDGRSSRESSRSRSRTRSMRSRPSSRSRPPTSAGSGPIGRIPSSAHLAPTSALSNVSTPPDDSDPGAADGVVAEVPAVTTLKETHSSPTESESGSVAHPLYDRLTSIPPGRSELLPAAAMLDHEIGRALVNYAAPEVAHIKGIHSVDIESLLGYADSEYVAVRENISLFDGKVYRGRRRKGRRERQERELEDKRAEEKKSDEKKADAQDLAIRPAEAQQVPVLQMPAAA